MEEIRRAAQKQSGRTGLILLFAEKRPDTLGADECNQTGILTSASNLTPVFPSSRSVTLGVCSRYSGATVPEDVYKRQVAEIFRHAREEFVGNFLVRAPALAFVGGR